MAMTDRSSTLTLQVGKPTRSSTLRATMAKDPSYLSPAIDTKSISRTVDMSPLAIKERQAKIFQGTPGHKRNLSLKNEISSLRPGVSLQIGLEGGNGFIPDD
jgi:hypothetical protein